MQNIITCRPLPHPSGRRAGSATALLTRLLPAFLLGLSLLNTPVRAQHYAWASPGTKASGKSAVATGKDGVSYVLTSFSGTITLANRTLTSLGSTDLLLVKYGPDGKAYWARRIGSSGEDLVGDVALHPDNGFVFVTGTFQSTVKFEDVSGNISMQLTSAGGSDAFVAQFHNQSGYAIWARQIGGAGTEKGNGIDTDQAGNAYLTGSFTGTTKATGGNASFALTSSGQSDIYLAKYNDKGTALMARRLGGAGFDFGAAVAVSPINGDIYLTGGLSPSSNLYITNAFVAKLDAAGTLKWNKPSGSPANVDAGTDITATNFGAYATGYFAGSVLFGNTTLTSSGSSDAFVVFYPSDAAANNTKAYNYGGGGWDEGQCIDNYNGDVYVGGTFTGKATLINGTFTALGGAADRDMFISRLPWGVSPGWTRRIGSTGFDYGNGGVSAPLNHAIFFTGHHGAPATLGNTTLSGSGGLITRIDLPFITDFKMVNATTDADIRTIKYKSEFNYQLLGTDKLNIRANTLNNGVGSIKFTLDGVTVKIENGTPPFTYAGDAPKAGGGTDYFGFTPTVGEHTLQAIAYSGPNATGEQAVPLSVTFSISNKPILAGLTLIDAFTDGDIKPLAGGETINCSLVNTTEFSIRANTNPGVVGSVKFVLNGVERIENTWPYAVAGDQPKPGGVDYTPMQSNTNYFKLTVTAYSGPNATGTASTPIDISFNITKGDAYRKAAARPGPETQPTSLSVAPNPFAGRTVLSFTAAEEGPASLEVYNVQGMAVARLYEGILQKGKTYEWPFDGSTQPAGLYFARLKLGHRVLYQRLVLSK